MKLAQAEAAVVGDNGSLESLARELHMWYLEATKQLNPANYNPKAQVPYDDMHEEQKQIDRYIARKITNLLAAKDREIEDKETETLQEVMDWAMDYGITDKKSFCALRDYLTEKALPLTK